LQGKKEYDSIGRWGKRRGGVKKLASAHYYAPNQGGSCKLEKVRSGKRCTVRPIHRKQPAGEGGRGKKEKGYLSHSRKGDSKSVVSTFQRGGRKGQGQKASRRGHRYGTD